MDTDSATGCPVLSGKILRDTAKKIETIFSVAVENGHDSLVLSALGCGAFSNPPLSIARLFKEAVAHFQSQLRVVSIAVIDDHNSGKAHNPDGNVRPFVSVFSK